VPPSRHYGYRPAYIEKLVHDCSTAAGYTKLTGKPARDKSTGAVIVDPPRSADKPWAADPGK